MVTQMSMQSGYHIPNIGLGTWQMEDLETLRKAVRAAVDAGYRMFDTAMLYGNEHALGTVFDELIKDGVVKREELFITTKLACIYMGNKERVKRGFTKSFQALGLQYIDLFLIHSPVGFKLQEDEAMFPSDGSGGILLEHCDLIETWRGLEELVDEGLVRSIGVSNFNMEQMERIRRTARHPLSVCQVEVHAYLQQEPLLRYCRESDIRVTAFAPLGSPAGPAKEDGSDILLQDKDILSMAHRHQKSPAQILLRFLVDKGVIIIPKSTNQARIRENIQIFHLELSDEETETLGGLDRKLRYFTTPWGINHPEYPYHEG